VNYNSVSPRDFTVNSISNSQHTQDGVSQSFTGKTVPKAIGVKFSLTFGKGSAAKKTVYIPESNLFFESRPTEETQPVAPEKESEVQLDGNTDEPAGSGGLPQTESANSREREADDKTIRQTVFRFIIRNDMFFLQGNEAEIERLYDFTDKYRSEIISGQMPVHVDGYCASFSKRSDNRRTAYFRASRVKSELITKKRLKEKHFITRVHAEGYMEEKDVVIVSFSFGSDTGM
jgi:hypothetical protein